jgi:uncharacterized membrane protein
VDSVAGQQDVMIAFFSAFAGFTAFGAVIATFLASSQALPWIAAWWGGHGVQEAREKAATRAERRARRRAATGAERWAYRRRAIALWSVAAGMGLAAIVSCVGLIFSFVWLRAGSAAAIAAAHWAYQWTGYLLIAEVALITAVTLIAAVGATLYVINTGPKTAAFLQAANIPEGVRVPSSSPEMLGQAGPDAAIEGTAP